MLLMLIPALPAWPEAIIKATRSAHMLVLNEVYLNGDGPFRMMIDTGDASSIIRPAIARRLALRPTYKVEQMTISGSCLVPAAVLDEIRVGSLSDKGVEVIITDVPLSGVDGVLGQSWLTRHDYMLDYHNRRLVLDGTPPLGGVRVPLRAADGRLLIPAEIDGRQTEVTLDSGASVVVLFVPRHPMPTAMLLTSTGAAGVETGAAYVSLEGGYRGSMPAARVFSLVLRWLQPCFRSACLPGCTYPIVRDLQSSSPSQVLPLRWQGPCAR
jgi:predicted aspartyl protease